MVRSGALMIVFWVLMLVWFIDLWMAGPTLRAFIPWFAVLVLGFAAVGFPAMTMSGPPRRDDRDLRP